MNKAQRIIGFLQEFSIPLLLGVVASLILANIDIHFYEKMVDYHVFGDDAQVFGHPLTAHFLINEMFMVFFFGIAAKEITDSVLPGGALNPIGRAINPLFGTLGGIIGPAGLYVLLAFVFTGGSDDFSTIADGWAIPTATDIALAWLVARIVFGAGHPAVNFLLLLAVADDAIGLGIIAVFYPDPEEPVAPIWLLLTAGGMGAAYAMRRAGVRHWIAYIGIAGAMSWVGLLKAAIEPALALVVIVPFLPAITRHGAVTAANKQPDGNEHPISLPGHLSNHSPLQQFEHHLKLFVDIGLFFFAFANAGVAFSSINSVTLIVLLSLVIGKMVGISLFSALGSKVGFPLPAGMGIKHLVVAGLIAGLGLTVALFVAGKAFPGPPFQDPAKMGAVFSFGVIIPAVILGTVFKVKEIKSIRIQK